MFPFLEIFFYWGGTKFLHFFKHSFFSAELIYSKKGSRGFREHAPPKNFLDTLMTILVLFEQFEGKVCLIILPLISTSPDVMQYVRTFSICARLGVRIIVIEEVQNYGKNCIYQKYY